VTELVGARFVLAVRDLQRSTQFYLDVLGFERDPIDATGWSFLSRGGFRLMLGECADAVPAGELGDHSYFAYVTVAGLDQLHAEVTARGAEVTSGPADKPWGLREFAVRTPDGHRLTFGEPLNASRT
jgi:catechol 2,3-dioxygenase-like lactoylglutathione lyase family enzyme